MPELYIINNPQLAGAEVYDEKVDYGLTVVDQKDNSQIERVLSHHSTCIV
jgi:hypothetical protein